MDVMLWCIIFVSLVLLVCIMCKKDDEALISSLCAGMQVYASHYLLVDLLL